MVGQRVFRTENVIGFDVARLAFLLRSLSGEAFVGTYRMRQPVEGGLTTSETSTRGFVGKILVWCSLFLFRCLFNFIPRELKIHRVRSDIVRVFSIEGFLARNRHAAFCSDVRWRQHAAAIHRVRVKNNCCCCRFLLGFSLVFFLTVSFARSFRGLLSQN